MGGDGVVGDGARCWSGGRVLLENFRGEEGRRSIGEGATYPGVFSPPFEGRRGADYTHQLTSLTTKKGNAQDL